MIDDTRGARCEVTPSQLASSIEEIGKHTIDRFHVKGWARSLRFLTFDDEQLDSYGGSKERKELCARCDLRVPIPATAHKCSSHGRFGRDSTKERPQALHACEHVARVTCSLCQNIPLFPNRTKARRFRIRRIFPKIGGVAANFTNVHDLPRYHESACNHFVALSYCWAGQPGPANQTPDDMNGEPYKVVEEDGLVRDARASRPTIDRTVAFAAQNGYRLIWIDQASFAYLHIAFHPVLQNYRNAFSKTTNSRRQSQSRPWT
jgi:hypothetical protein